MKVIYGGFFAALFFIVNASSVYAGTIFNNYGPGYTYETSSGWSIGGPNSSSTANEFTALLTEPVSSIKLGVSLVSGQNRIVVALMTSENGNLGTVIETYTVVDQMGNAGSQNAPLIADSVTNPTLVAGEKYWLVISPDGGYAAWNFNLQGVEGNLQQSFDGGNTWIAFGVLPLGAFEIIGTASTVPEPSSLAILGCGVAALAAAYVTTPIRSKPASIKPTI